MKKKILVVDDELYVRQMIKTRLEANDYAVVVASDGKEALEKVDVESPDLILLDIMMPEMDGHTFVRELKSKHLEKQVPIIVLTAKGACQDLFEMEGVRDYLVKPYQPDELINKVKQYLV